MFVQCRFNLKDRIIYYGHYGYGFIYPVLYIQLYLDTDPDLLRILRIRIRILRMQMRMQIQIRRLQILPIHILRISSQKPYTSFIAKQPI